MQKQTENITAKKLIQYFTQLGDPKTTKIANEALMKLIRKQQIWKIAKKIILDNQYQQLGCQVLCRKLNFPYTQELQQKYNIVNFILSLPKLNPTLYLCLAKLALHLYWTSLDFKQPFGNDLTVLQILKYLPEVSDIITLSSLKQPRQHVLLLFNYYKPTLVTLFQKYPDDVLDCLKNYVENGYKINSQQLVKLILIRPFTDTSQILENILLEQSYPSLNNIIFEYLVTESKNNMSGSYFGVFLALFRAVNLITVEPSFLKSILGNIISLLHVEVISSNQDRKEIAYISDSFDFWQELSQKINQIIKPNKQTDEGSDQMMDKQPHILGQIDNKNGGQSLYKQQIYICLQAYLQVYKVVVRRSKLHFMPNTTNFQKNRQLEIIQVDDDDDDDETQHKNNDLVKYDQLGSSNNTFRNTGEEYLDIIIYLYTNIIPDLNYTAKMLAYVLQLSASSDELEVQLSIFVLSQLIENLPSNPIVHKCISDILMSLIQNPTTSKSIYILKQLIKLLGKFSHQAICNIDILKYLLYILSQAQKIDQLAILSCQNFTQILQKCNTSSRKREQQPLLQQYIYNIYYNMYYKTTNDKLFDAVTKCMFVYLYHFKQEVNAVVSYLKQLRQYTLAVKEIKRQCQILESVAISHLFIQAELSNNYLPILSQFFVSLFELYINRLMQSQQKKLGLIFKQINTILYLCGGYHTDKWIEFICTIQNLQRLSLQANSSKNGKGNDKHMLHIISLYTKIIDIQQHDSFYRQRVVKFISQFEHIVASTLQNISKSQQNICEKCLQFNLCVLNKYVESLPNYNVDNLTAFIVQKLYKGYYNFEYTTMKIGLAIVRSLISKRYYVQEFLQQTLKIYAKLSDLMWRSLQTILYEAYHKGGAQVYIITFKHIYPQLAPPNPLFESFIQALHQSRAKDIKNLLINLK